MPVTSRGERIGTVYLAADPEPLSRRLTRYLVIGLLVVMAALVVVVLGIAQSALRRANRELEERADALAGANAELKVQVSERTKAEEQLRQAHKMQALGQLTGGIAHDFNNLLTVIQGSADMLRRPGISRGQARSASPRRWSRPSSRAAALTGQLLAFARRQPLQPEVIDLNALIRGMTDLLDRTLGERIEVTHRALGRAPARSRPTAPSSNRPCSTSPSTRATPCPTAACSPSAPRRSDEAERGAMIALSVGDSGTGMDEDTLNRAFEPFFTTKTTGKGTGLGLSQVYGFASQSGGDVRIDSRPGEGTIVTLLLPCSGRGRRTPRAAEGQMRASRRGRTGRILLVEDNEEVGEFAERPARRARPRGRARPLGRGGARARAGGSSSTLVFTDVVMPGMSGLDLAERLAEQRPAPAGHPHHRL